MEAPLKLDLVATHPTAWDPASATVSMNLRMDGCIVPSEAEGGRLSYSHIVVLDDFLDDAPRRQLRDFLTAADALSNGTAKGQPDKNSPADSSGFDPIVLPMDRWERKTADMAGGAATWGVKHHALQALASGQPPAVVEVQSRLQKLYPEYAIAHMPSTAIQGAAAEAAGADCTAFLANAAVQGDHFQYHVDADPTSFPPGPWTETFGDYFNGEPGRPLLVSLLLYLNDEWERDWAADTLFLDAATDTGAFVRPRAGRAVLMHQDALHRVSAPSAAAEGRPRLSLVWKLAFLSKHSGEACSLGRPEWGPPTSFGSAAKLDAVKRQLARERQKAAKT